MKRTPTLIFLFLFLSACGGSDGGSHTAKEYQLFPSNYLAADFSESYSISGEDQIGIPYDGTYTIQRWPNTVIDDSPVIPVFEILNYKNLFTNAVITSTAYYSGSLSNLQIIDIGSSLQPGVQTASATTHVIPLSAKTGEFGEIGTYIDNVGNTTVYTWELAKAGNNKALLTFYATITDQFDELTGTMETTYRISSDGERSNISIILYSPKQNITLEFSGSKNTTH